MNYYHKINEFDVREVRGHNSDPSVVSSGSSTQGSTGGEDGAQASSIVDSWKIEDLNLSSDGRSAIASDGQPYVHSFVC